METTALVMEQPGSLKTETIQLPELGENDLRMRVELSGICGTDVHMNNGGMELDFPIVPGHEFAGVIDEIGENVRTDSKGEPINAGDAVTVVPGIVCGECWYCNNVPARPTTCQDRDVYGFRSTNEAPHAHGGFSRHVIIEDGATFYRLPDSMPVELGALAEPLSVATHAFERAYQPGVPYAREGFGIGKSIAIQGAGPIGLLAMSAAQAAGAGTIIAIDAIEERLSLATKFGATETINLNEHNELPDLKTAVNDRTNGNVGPDVVIEAAGVPTAFQQGIELVRDGGTLVEVGHYADAGTTEINPTRIVQKDINLFGSLAYPPNQFETAISLLSQLQDDVPFSELFNHQVGFTNAQSAYEKQESGEAYRATIHPFKS